MIEGLVSKVFSILSLFFIIALGLIVIKNSRKLVNKLFFLLTLILIIWVFGSFMMFGSKLDNEIIFWDRFVYAGIIFWFSIQYHFSLAVTYINLKRRIILWFAYAFSILFLVLSRTDYFVSGIFHYAWGAHMKAQIFHHFFIAIFSSYVLLFFYTLLKKYHKEKNKAERSRILIYIFGFSVLDFVGGTAFLPAYSIAVYPVFLATPLIFSIIIAYSIVYFGLMNIKLIMRRYFVYFLSLSSLVLPSYFALYYVFLFYRDYLLALFIAIYILSLLFFERIKKTYYRLANKYFFSSLYDSQELIFSLNNNLHSSLDVKKIFESITSILIQAFHCKSIAAINFNYKRAKWSVIYNNNFSAIDSKTDNLNHETIRNLFINKKSLSLKDIENGHNLDNEFISYLKNLNVELVLPIKINKKQLTSLLFFGPKESGEAYNEKDLEILEYIAGEIGLTIENALLYQSVKKFNVKLQNEINKATKKLQEQNETLIKLDRLKDEFVGIVSHQLRTPLTGIRWFTEMLFKNSDKNLNNKQLGLLQKIRVSNLSLIKLVNDLLEVSHIETGHKFEIVKNNFNLNDLINEVIKENVYLIETKKLKITNNILNDLEIYADRDKIKQVWQNLITNASKYSRENAEIKIYLKTKKTGELIFYVEDKGIGVPKKQQSKLFTKFFRATNASLQYTEGTGLGLYIAREIVRAHGGEMSFKSKEKVGSIFFFSIPINKNKK